MCHERNPTQANASPMASGPTWILKMFPSCIRQRARLRCPLAKAWDDGMEEVDDTGTAEKLTALKCWCRS